MTKIVYHYMDVIFSLELLDEEWHIRIENELLKHLGFLDKAEAKKVAHKYIEEMKEVKNVN